jgi:AraC-like DNA-binding protein
MAYNYYWIILRIDTILTSSPRCSMLGLEQTLKIGRHTLEKAILRFTGMTFRQYHKLKILEACDRLLRRNEDLTIKEMAAALGYRQATSLSRFVKRSTGRTVGFLKATEGIIRADSNNAPQMLHNSPKC